MKKKELKMFKHQSQNFGHIKAKEYKQTTTKGKAGRSNYLLLDLHTHLFQPLTQLTRRFVIGLEKLLPNFTQTDPEYADFSSFGIPVEVLKFNVKL
ncbi:hypothetical protein BY996DRAFT_6595573 [Phakopsora pachyrhizi]|nr:hypothetical protein BY996DRAFT_6595573 [Phakopsora pachyrhizi]